MSRAVLALAAAALVALVAPTSRAADPSAPTPRACPKDKLWDEKSNGCVCAPPTAWDDATRKCLRPGAAPPPPVAPPPAAPPARPVPPPPPRAPQNTCMRDQVWSDAHQRCIVTCPEGQVADARGTSCIAVPAEACAVGSEWSDDVAACVPVCPPGKVMDVNGACIERPDSRPATPACPAGRERVQRDGPCVASCPAGTRRSGKGNVCVSDPKSCPDGKEWKEAWNACVPLCPAGQVLDFQGKSCHPIRRRQ